MDLLAARAIQAVAVIKWVDVLQNADVKTESEREQGRTIGDGRCVGAQAAKCENRLMAWCLAFRFTICR
jgi:hypothetical protein